MMQPLRALIVEDNDNDELLLERALRKQGFDLTSTRVETEPEMVAALAEPWDVVLSDFSLPQFSGPEALRVMQEQGLDLPFIVISGTIGEEAAIRTLKAGASDYMMKGQLARLGEAIRREIKSAQSRRDQQQAEAQILHLNRVLRAIRNVNQLIVREKDPGRLIAQACEMLVESRGYRGAWIALGDGDGPATHCSQAGLGDTFEPFAEMLRRGQWPACREVAAGAPEGLAEIDAATTCTACPHHAQFEHDVAVVALLRHDDRTRGILGVSFPRDLMVDGEERDLLIEVAGDIGFALHSIEIEQQSLRESRRAQQYLDIAGVMLVALDREGIVTMINRKGCDLLGYPEAEIVGKNWFEHFVPPEVRGQLEEVSSALLEGAVDEAGHHLNPILTRSGEERWIAWTNTPIRDEEGHITGHLSSGEDVTERRDRDQHIRFLSEIVQQMPDGVLCTDREFKITYMNPAAERLFGWTTAELVGQTPGLFNAEPQADEQQQGIYRDIASGKVVEGEALNRRKNGSTFTCQFRISPVVDALGSTVAYVAAQRDVSERKRLEQEHQEALRKTATLLRATRAVLHTPDFTRAAREIFDAAADHIGATAGYLALLSDDGENNEVLFLEAGDLPCTVDPDLPMPIRGLREEAYRSGRAVFDNSFRTSKHWELMPEGHVELGNVLFAPLVLDETAVGIIGLANKAGGFTDRDARVAEACGEIAAVTLREHRTREAQHASEEQFRTLFDSSADAIMTLAPPSWRFSSGNPATVRMFGARDEADFVSRGPWEVSPELQPDGRPSGEKAREMIENAMRDGSNYFDWTHQTIDGQAFPATVLLTRMELNGEPLLQATVRDVTEYRALQAQVAQSDRLSSMGMLAAGVAHEINNPLSYILYNLESLSEDLPRLADNLRLLRTRLEGQLGIEAFEELTGDAAQALSSYLLEDLQARFRDALDGTQRIREIARGLGTFSKVEKDELLPVNLMQVIEVATNMAFNEIKYRARLVKDFGRVPSVMASEGRLCQVFLNLIINATHAINEGDVDHNEIRVRTWTEGDHACAEVSDTGSGIAPEHLERLWEPFFTTKKIGSGSGLGLAISRNIVESYLGTIEVSSELGKGTRFTVRLPVQALQENTTTATEEKASASTPSCRILIVDDEKPIRSVLVRLLRDHETVEAGSGLAAREIIEQDQAFDLIVCDMMMPEMSGMDLHAWLVEAHPELARRLIFVSGGAFTPRAREYLSKIDNIRLEKPFDVAEFKRIVSEMLRGSAEP